MSRLPRVTVVVPVYNDVERLRGCLEALRGQDLDSSEFEVLVVDNGSEEDPSALIDADPMARLLREPSPGSYAARNRALGQARGDIIAFTDADCEPSPSWLSRGVGRLEEDGAVDIVAGSVLVHAADRTRPALAERYDEVFAFPIARYVDDFSFGVTANLFARRAVFDAVGPFDAALQSGGDAEWCQRAVGAGRTLAYADDVVVHHPARRTVTELLVKTRRVARGREELRARREGAPGAVAAQLKRGYRRAVQDMGSALRRSRGPAHARLALAGLAAVLQVVDTWESIRCHRRAGRGAPTGRG